MVSVSSFYISDLRIIYSATIILHSSTRSGIYTHLNIM